MKTEIQQEYFDVFMSYRRDGGSAIATLLVEKLRENPDLKIFLDMQEIASGDWAARIENSLIKSSNFLFLLTPGSLRRCFADPANDVVFREIQKACELRAYCENTPEKGAAENRFRIIPVFLGEKIDALCEEYQGSHPHVIEVIRSLVRHNGINLNDASSINIELNRLEKVMLLKSTGKFAGTLIEKALLQSGDLRNDKGRQDLEELFASYLHMFDQTEYGQVRDALQPLVHSRLMKVLETAESGHFDDKLKSFKLGILKAACAELIHPSAAHGSRLRVVRNTERWLRGEKIANFAGTENNATIIDRALRVSRYLSEFILKNKNITRTTLSEVIRSRTGSDSKLDFRFFSPEGWRRYQEIVDEIFERLTYRQICLEFLKKNWQSLQKQPAGKKLTVDDRRNRKIFMANLQKFIWNRIREDYSLRVAELSKNASVNTYIAAIEAFISYADGFEFCEEDYNPLQTQDENDVDSSSEEITESQDDDKEEDESILEV